MSSLPPYEGLRVLCIDGGGIKGYTALLILKRIFRTLQSVGNLAEEPRPCDVFDLIVGTSTGGLIAVELGRLHMTVDECIEQYKTVGGQVFGKRPAASIKLFKGTINRPFYDIQTLQEAIKMVLGKQGVEHAEWFREDGAPLCKVMLCVTRKAIGKPDVLRNYRTSHPTQENYECKIWEAASATAAAPMHFKRVKFENSGEKWCDGGLRRNNPIIEALAEVSREEAWLDEQIGCVLSLGTGVSKMDNVSDNLLWFLIESVKIMTDSENTADEFAASQRGKEFTESGRYFRFSVPQGLQELELDECNETEKMSALTTEYLRKTGSGTEVNRCAESLLRSETNPTRATSTHQTIPPVSGSASQNFDSYILALTISPSVVDLDERDDECLRALFVTDPSVDRKAVENRKDTLLKDCCSWVVQDDTYADWKDDDCSNLLWIRGEPGKGKTMIAMSLVDALCAEMDHPHTSQCVVAYFFCNNTDDKRNTTNSIIRSLLYQILRLQPSLLSLLRTDFKIQKDKMFTSIEATWKALQTVLEKSSLQEVYLVVDALDECDTQSLEALLRLLQGYVPNESSSSCPNQLARVKWLLTSRNETLIRENLEGCSNIDLGQNSIKVAEGVQRFIEEKVGELAKRKRYGDKLKAFVKDTLYRKAEGTFLWVALACQELQSLPLPLRDTRLTLERLPAGLRPLYGRIMEQIMEKNRNTENQNVALDILRSVVVAVRPLTLKELGIMADLPSESRHDLGSLTEQAELCGSLLTIREDSVYLVHQSAKDYLLSSEETIFSKDLAREHTVACARCFRYICSLSVVSDHSDEADRLVEKSPVNGTTRSFIRYSVLYWMDHGRDPSPDIAKMISFDEDFFQPESELWQEWLRIYSRARQHRVPVPPGFLPLHLFAYSGMYWAAFNVLNRSDESYVDAVDSAQQTALHWATISGCDTIVALLLEKGADIDAQDQFRCTALHSAASHGQDTTVTLLIEKGANIGAQDEDGETALHSAASYRQDTTVTLLIEKGANIEAQDKDGETALHGAALRGYNTTVALLVENGANIEAQTKDGKTPLDIARERENDEVVALLEQTLQEK
ncbi:MAG: hypothetical protein M1833_006636, partial [Piccolia ochrophora]